MTAYYNEIDPFAAQWLRNLIAAGHIAPGEVDDRSILDVSPDDLAGFAQCHFFAGIGVWSYALRLAGWPDDQPAWTGSCPCQPFSVAGVGAGMDDQRHLWPYWFHLIEQRRPAVVFGEQVEAAIRHGWLDLVQADLEGISYAFAAVGILAAGIGAPHIRQRLFFVADALQSGRPERWPVTRYGQATGGGITSRLADADGERRPGDKGTIPGIHQGTFAIEPDGMHSGLADVYGRRRNTGREGCQALGHGPAIEPNRCVGGLEHTRGQRWERGQTPTPGHHHDGQASDRAQGEYGIGESGPHRISEHTAGPLHGFWRNADWLLCRDGKWRPVEPGTFPLAHGATARVGRLRAYGNAICAPLAAEFVSAFMECRP
ncbi:DNA cytosine methyltransferase [Castellaniella sp.]|uniref:DNA cytosine methyltransferase n=1 Tax=Castellaniella sp. TaxID=1955812 RepID=UPI002AFDD48E|nr:DNA cytosine methyltransferase [Castellaniella sp.]